MPQGNQVRPFVRIAPQLRTVLASHVALKLVDRYRLRPADHIERNGLVRIATEAPYFEIEVSRVQRVPQCRRWLRRSLEAEHAFAPCVAGEPIGLLADLLSTLCRSPRERMHHRLTGGTWWSSDIIAREASNGKPLGFARHMGWSTARRGCE